MNLSDDAKKIYELNFSVVKSIVAMLFVAHGTGLVTLFATDAVKYRTPLFILGIGFMCLISLIMLSYIFFSFYFPYNIIINSDDLNYKEKEGVLLVHSSCFPRGCISLPD